MNKDDIIRMAYEAVGGRPPDGWGVMFDHDQLERFAALVAAAEREACAKVCDEMEVPAVIYGAHPDYVEGKLMAKEQCADAIRARRAGMTVLTTEQENQLLEEYYRKHWSKLMLGVRVEGDAVVIKVKGGNEAARILCWELLKEKKQGGMNETNNC